MHFGRIDPRCMRKHSELDKQFHKYKGRIIYRGDSAKDQDDNCAVYADMASSASLLAGSRMVDATGLMSGHGCEQSDAPGAYTQTELGGKVVTWISIPRNRHPPEWRKFKRPVCILRLALYGHPLSGCFWERKVNTSLTLEAWKRSRNGSAAITTKSSNLYYLYTSMISKWQDQYKTWKQDGKQ